MKIMPLLLTIFLIADVGLGIFGELRLTISQAQLTVAVVGSGFVPAYIASQSKDLDFEPNDAWHSLCCGLLMVAPALALLFETNGLLLLTLVALFFGVFIVESRAVIQARPYMAISVRACGLIVFYLAFYFVFKALDSVLIACMVAGLFSSVIPILTNFVLPYRGEMKPFNLSVDKSRRWICWQSRFYLAPFIQRAYVLLIPVVAGFVSTTENVAIFSLAISTSELMSHLTNRLVSVNLGTLIRSNDAEGVRFENSVIKRARNARVISGTMSVSVISLLLVAELTSVSLLDNNVEFLRYGLEVTGFIFFPLVQAILGPVGPMLAQTGYELNLRNNALIGGGIFIFLVGLTAYFFPNSIFVMGFVYFLSRTVNVFLNYRLARKNGFPV